MHHDPHEDVTPHKAVAREQQPLERFYGSIGIPAVAAAARYQGEVRKAASLRALPGPEDRFTATRA